MKNTRQCPKCGGGANDILRIPSSAGRHGNSVPSSGLWNVAVVRFVCGKCGYSEEWIESPDDVERLRKLHPTLKQLEERAKNPRPPLASMPSALPPLPRCPQCETPLIDFGRGLACPMCSKPERDL